MNPLIPLTCASTLLLPACTSSPQDQAGVVTAEHHYRCASGARITASYPSTESATVQYKDNSYAMQIAISASGARYVGGGLEWWTKGSGPGSEGTLFRHMADGSSGDILESCDER